MLNCIANEPNGKALWNKLEILYASKICNNKLFVLKQVIHLPYKEDNSVFDHLNEFQGCFDELFGM